MEIVTVDTHQFKMVKIFDIIFIIKSQGINMSVIINSTIKTNALGRWYIELNDTTKEEHMEICLDVNEYAVKIEAIGAEYGGDIDVAWSAEDDVTKEQINEVRMQMNAYEHEREQQKAAEAVGGMSQTHQADGTPNF